MKNSIRRVVLALVVAIGGAAAIVHAQQQGGLTAAERAHRWDVENELQALAIVDRKVMVPMKDGIRLATDVYRPKTANPGRPGGTVPTIWVRTRGSTVVVAL